MKVISLHNINTSINLSMLGVSVMYSLHNKSNVKLDILILAIAIVVTIFTFFEIIQYLSKKS